MKGRLVIRIAALLSLTGIAVVCAVLYTLAGTNRGSEWLLQHLDGLSDAWDISAQNVSGSLLHGLTLDNFFFEIPQTVSVKIDRLHFEWHPQTLLQGSINISPFEAKGIEINLMQSDNAVDKAPIAYDSYNLRPPLAIAVKHAQLRDITVNSPDATFKVPDLDLKKGSLGRTLKIQQLDLFTETYSVTVEQARVATASPFESEVEIAWRLKHSDNMAIEGHGELKGNLEAFNIEHALTSPVNVKSTGVFQPGLLNRQPPHFELNSRISESRWRRGQDTILMSNGLVELRGWYDDYSMQAQGMIKAPDSPEIALEFTGDGNLRGMQVRNLTIRALDGSLTTVGEFSWQPSVNWDLHLQASDLDPGVYWNQWPGKLAMQGHIKGEYSSSVLEGNLRIDSLAGTLRNYPLQASGDISVKKGQWSSQGLELRLGKNTIKMDGAIGDTITAKWDANLPNLTAIWPDLHGKLIGQGTLESSASDINLTGKLRAENLKFQNYSAAFINLRAVSNSQPESNFRHTVKIEAGGLNVNDFPITHLHSELNGNIENHRFLADLSTQYGTVGLDVSGLWQGRQWQATLHHATLSDTVTGTWRLQTPSSLLVSAELRSMTETCWRQNQASACISGSISDSEIKADAILVGIPLDLAKPWLPTNLEIHGQMNGRLQIEGSLAAPQGVFMLEPDNGHFLVRQAEGEVESYPWRNARLQIDFAENTYSLTAGLQLPDQGTASALITLDPQKRLNGTVNLNFSQLAWVEAWTPSLRDIQGAFEARLYLSGTLEHPQWLGSARLYRASTTLPGLGIIVEKLALTLETDDKNRVSIQGSAESGPGHLLIDGRLDKKTVAQLWELSLTIKGNRFEVLNIPEMHVLATPELNVNASRELITVKGEILLPEVDIRLQNLPNRAVKVSEDAVIVNQPENTTAQTNGIPVKTNIKLTLGNRAHFNGFGFEAQLSGSLDLIEEPGQPTLAYGTLTINQGRYKAFGQNLSVEHGRLIFQGPYDNPGLDIRAVRKTSDVTVGLNIGGTLNDIRSSVFSEPALPDSEAVAILLTGKPLSGASKSEANLLVNAIASLGIKKSQPITSQLSETFGLDVLTIDSESGLEQSSLTIGKYLTPRLYVRYAIGLFDQLSKLALEYSLTEHLMVEAKSGKDQSMDIIYRIER